MNKVIKIFLISTFSLLNLYAQPAIPYGHSHNDYMQKRPLYEAVELGYGSIEIDVCLDKNNQIKVAHNPVFLSSKKTIEEMYFDPIVKMMEEKDTIFKYSKEYPLVLVIDIKTNADSTYKYLRQTLVKYEKYITTYNSKTGVTLPAQLKISLTGKRPVKPIIREEIQLVKIDIGLKIIAPHDFEFPDDLPVQERFLIGQVNLPYRKFLSYNGAGEYTKEQKEDITILANISHMHREPLRLYAIGNNPRIWKYLLDAGVDWINVDKLKKFAKFYKGYSKEKTN